MQILTPNDKSTIIFFLKNKLYLLLIGFSSRTLKLQEFQVFEVQEI
jgi:hypothetical protein